MNNRHELITELAIDTTTPSYAPQIIKLEDRLMDLYAEHDHASTVLNLLDQHPWRNRREIPNQEAELAEIVRLIDHVEVTLEILRAL